MCHVYDPTNLYVMFIMYAGIVGEDVGNCGMRCVMFDLYFVYMDGTMWKYSLRRWNHDIGLTRWICGNIVYRWMA